MPYHVYATLALGFSILFTKRSGSIDPDLIVLRLGERGDQCHACWCATHCRALCSSAKHRHWCATRDILSESDINTR